MFFTLLYVILMTCSKDQPTHRNLSSPDMCDQFVNQIVLIGPVLEHTNASMTAELE